MNDPKLLTPKEVSGMMRCGVDFVLAEIRSGNLAPAIRINQRVILVSQETAIGYLKKKSGDVA